jgi:uncharacterized protein (TIGR00369 family)
MLDLAAIQALMERSPFSVFLRLRAVELDPAGRTLRVQMPVRAETERSSGSGQIHGGAIAAMVDIAGDYAGGAWVGGGVPTTGLQVDYLSPARRGSLEAVARVRRIGRTLAVADIDVLDGQARLVAIARGTYFVGEPARPTQPA